MLSIRGFFIAPSLVVLLSVLSVNARGQAAQAEGTKLALKAALVLTPDFCATKTKKGTFLSGKETFEIGKAACRELEPALKGAFSDVTRVVEASSTEGAEVVLMPKFVDVDATKSTLAFSNREMIVLIEWTVKDQSGKTVWIETVQGSAKHHIGNMITYKKNLKLIVEDSMKDAAAQSASKMSSAPELRNLGRH
jgi:hypothetical protein